MQRKMCFPWTEKSNEVLIWNYWTVILLPCYWPWSCLMDRKVQGGLSHSVWKKEKDVWGTTYCIHHGRKVMLNTLLMFKTVSAIIFSWEKADWSPSFISSVSTKRVVSFHLVCWNLHSEQEVWSQRKMQPASSSQGTIQRLTALSKTSEGFGGQQADGTTLCLLGDISWCN